MRGGGRGGSAALASPPRCLAEPCRAGSDSGSLVPVPVPGRRPAPAPARKVGSDSGSRSWPLGPALVRCATEGMSKARKEAASLLVPSALGTGPALKARLVCLWLESSLVCACACLRERRGPAGPRLCRRGKARLGLGVCWGGSEWRGKGGGGRVRLVMRERSESSDKGDSAQALSGRGGGPSSLIG